MLGLGKRIQASCDFHKLMKFSFDRNPNEHHRQDSVLVASKERNRFRSITWENYDPVHQKYLEIGKLRGKSNEISPNNVFPFAQQA